MIEAPFGVAIENCARVSLKFNGIDLLSPPLVKKLFARILPRKIASSSHVSDSFALRWSNVDADESRRTV